jgi:glycosyltransferase involved in cell wall biosynthesis
LTGGGAACFAIPGTAAAAGTVSLSANPQAAWSVIVPTYRRPHQLARCVTALGQLEPPAGGFEVVVVNDGGSEPDAALLLGAGMATSIRFLSQAHAGPSAARNQGARTATGKWIAFTDDDCAPEPDWLRAFERALAVCPDALVGGTNLNTLTDSMFSEASQLLVHFVAEWFDGAARERFFTSNNIALARARFFEAGGFNEDFWTNAGEDREFCDRWSAQGRASTHVADAIVHHTHALSMRSFLRQHFAYGRSARLFRRGRSVAGRPVRIDPGFYVASLRHAARVRPVLRGATLTACTVMAHAAYLAGFTRESVRRDKTASASPI